MNTVGISGLERKERWWIPSEHVKFEVPMGYIKSIAHSWINLKLMGEKQARGLETEILIIGWKKSIRTDVMA